MTIFVYISRQPRQRRCHAQCKSVKSGVISTGPVLSLRGADKHVTSKVTVPGQNGRYPDVTGNFKHGAIFGSVGRTIG
ncbi:hypothetical protein RRG08_049604 [Elysia crispata]|uniref:Uncharacterized protein n=1 Tax=Elysia crispata TaxID=231223 RepID=A0AAE1E4L9_9GAST|nr:hypothetical protein RRG08_049604 [Elysia crispata]